MSATEATRTQRWVRIGGEGLAIVVSILIAFSIDRWWDYRQERAEEHEILSQLDEEFTGFDSELVARTAFYDSTVARLEWLLNDAASDRSADVARLDQAVGTMVGAPTFDVASGVIAGVMASDRLSVIRNDALRTRLITWQKAVDDALENELIVRQYLATVVVPHLAAREIPIGRAMRTWRGERWRLAEVDTASARVRYRRLASDSDFRALAAWRYDWALGSASASRRAETEARAILDLVRLELGR